MAAAVAVAVGAIDTLAAEIDGVEIAMAVDAAAAGGGGSSCDQRKRSMRRNSARTAAPP